MQSSPPPCLLLSIDASAPLKQIPLPCSLSSFLSPSLSPRVVTEQSTAAAAAACLDLDAAPSLQHSLDAALLPPPSLVPFTLFDSPSGRTDTPRPFPAPVGPTCEMLLCLWSLLRLVGTVSLSLSPSVCLSRSLSDISLEAFSLLATLALRYFVALVRGWKVSSCASRSAS